MCVHTCLHALSTFVIYICALTSCYCYYICVHLLLSCSLLCIFFWYPKSAKQFRVLVCLQQFCYCYNNGIICKLYVLEMKSFQAGYQCNLLKKNLGLLVLVSMMQSTLVVCGPVVSRCSFSLGGLNRKIRMCSELYMVWNEENGYHSASIFITLSCNKKVRLLCNRKSYILHFESCLKCCLYHLQMLFIRGWWSCITLKFYVLSFFFFLFSCIFCFCVWCICKYHVR